MRDPDGVSAALQWQGGEGGKVADFPISAALQWQGGGGEGRRFSYLLESHMTYLAGSHILRSWPVIRLREAFVAAKRDRPTNTTCDTN